MTDEPTTQYCCDRTLREVTIPDDQLIISVVVYDTEGRIVERTPCKTREEAIALRRAYHARQAVAPPAPPLPEAPCSVVNAVIQDLADRAGFGLEKYQVTVGDSPLSLLQWHQHHYEELLDAAVYTRKIIMLLKAQASE